MANEATWRIFGDDTVACLLAPAEVPGWLYKHVPVMPNEAAVVLRNGKTDEIVTHQRVSIPGLAESLWNRIKGLAGKDEQVDVMMVDTSFRDLTLPVSLVAQDKEVIEGECRIRLRARLEAAYLLFGLLKRVSLESKLKRPQALSVLDVYERLRIDWEAKALAPIVVQHTSAEFRGNKALQDEAEMASMTELQGLLSRWGLVLDGLTINWAVTEAEKQQVQINRLKREDALKDFQNDIRLAELRRQNQIDAASIENLQRLKMLSTTGEQDERTLVRKYELGRIGLEDEQRLSTAGIDNKIHALQIDMKRREVDLRLYETERETEIETKQALGLFKAVQDAKTGREKLRVESQEKLTLEAMARGIKPAELKDFYREQTLQQMAADGSDAQIKAMSEAEAAQHRLDIFKEAEERERRHQAEDIKLSADLMQAAKPNVPETLVQGGTPATHLVTPASVRKPSEAEKTSLVCSCGEPLELGWRICPACQKPLSAQVKPKEALCPNCGAKMQPTWKACPYCMAKLG